MHMYAVAVEFVHITTENILTGLKCPFKFCKDDQDFICAL